MARKVVFLVFKGKVLQREVHVTAQRSGGVLVNGLMAVRTSSPPDLADLKDGDKIKIKDNQERTLSSNRSRS